MVERAGRTTICSILFVDIARYSEAVDALQLAMKARLDAAIAEAVAGIAEQARDPRHRRRRRDLLSRRPRGCAVRRHRDHQALRAERRRRPALRTGIISGRSSW